MKIKNVLLIILLTALSSFLSTAIIFFLKENNLLIYSTIPGIVFSLVLGIYFKITRKISLGNIMRWFFYSFMAYFFAFWSAYWGFFIMGGYVVGGIVGASALAIYTRKFISQIKEISPIIIIGVIAGFIFGLFFSRGIEINTAFHIENISQTFFAYFIWQALVTLALEYFMSKEENTPNYNTQTMNPSTSNTPKSTRILWLGVLIFITTCLIFFSWFAKGI